MSHNKWDLYGQRVSGFDGWSAASLKCGAGGDVHLAGAVYIRRSGRVDYQESKPGTYSVLTVTRGQMAEFEAEFEASGRCFGCGGDGRQVRRVSVADGVEYEACERCKGSGAAPRLLQTPPPSPIAPLQAESASPGDTGKAGASVEGGAQRPPFGGAR